MALPVVCGSLELMTKSPLDITPRLDKKSRTKRSRSKCLPIRLLHFLHFPVLMDTLSECVRVYSYSRRRYSRMGIALICLCDSFRDSVYLSVCPHDKTKTAETKINKLGIMDSPSRYFAHQWILGQRSNVEVRVRVRRSSAWSAWVIERSSIVCILYLQQSEITVTNSVPLMLNK